MEHVGIGEGDDSLVLTEDTKAKDVFISSRFPIRNFGQLFSILESGKGNIITGT